MKDLLNNDSLLALTEGLLGKKIGRNDVFKIQQSGTKYKGYVYLDISTNLLYECITSSGSTTTTTNTTTNFKKCGVSENESKLENLSSYFNYSNFVSGYGMFKSSSFVSKNSIESDEYPVGIYMITSNHSGSPQYGFAGVVSIGRYTDGDSWVKVSDIKSGPIGGNYNLEYNSYTGKFRNTTEYNKTYLVTRISS